MPGEISRSYPGRSNTLRCSFCKKMRKKNTIEFLFSNGIPRPACSICRSFTKMIDKAMEELESGDVDSTEPGGSTWH